MKILKFNPKKSKAQAMVEFAIVLPILLLVVYGLIEVGRLIFIIASVNNATRQAARYGSTSGVGPNGIARYLDCNGIRDEVQGMDFLNIIDDADIDISYDHGTTGSEFGNCNGSSYAPTSGSLAPVTNDRVVVFVDAQFDTIVPLVPIDPQTIEATSSRTLLLTISIEPPKEPTITYITADTPDPSEIGQSVTVSVEVTGTATTPTGTVTISGADTNCTVTLINGAGSCNIVFSSVTTTLPETRTITATYGGDSTHDTSSDTENHTVDKALSTVVINSDSPDPSQPNQDVSVSVTVSSFWPNPTGTVDITGADTNCIVTLSSGTGSCNVNFANATSPRTLTATYNGDSTHKSSDPDTETHTVIQPNGTVTTITSDTPDPSLIGQSVTVSVAVTGNTTPTGTVAITGADTSCTITLSGGIGNCTVVFNSDGPKTLTAIYGGDANNAGSQGTATHSVDLFTTTTTITTDSPDPSAPGQTVAVTVSVTGGSTLPTGTVNITGADTNCSIILSGGTGSCNIVFIGNGPKSLTAQYTGDSTHAPSQDDEPHLVTTPPITGCNTVTVSKLKMVSGTLVIDITNPLLTPLQISNVTVTWNHDKGYQSGGSDKTLELTSASLGSVVFWTYSGTNPPGENGPTYTITPTITTNIPAASGPTTPTTTRLTFTFHQPFDRWDNTENITINLATPGCEGVILFQNQH